MTENESIFAEKLEKLFDEVRKPNGSKYTQTEVVEGTDGVLTRVYLWKLRKGHATNPGFHIIKALADFFHVDTNYFTQDEASTFFLVTGSFLIVIAAGLVGHSVMALQELGWLPIGTATAWDLGWLIPNEALGGRLLHAFVGYDAAPTLLMVFAYLSYMLFFGAKFIMGARSSVLVR